MCCSCGARHQRFAGQSGASPRAPQIRLEIAARWTQAPCCAGHLTFRTTIEFDRLTTLLHAADAATNRVAPDPVRSDRDCVCCLYRRHGRSVLPNRVLGAWCAHITRVFTIEPYSVELSWRIPTSSHAAFYCPQSVRPKASHAVMEDQQPIRRSHPGGSDATPRS